MAEYENVLVEIDGAVATITLNRPEKLNAISGGLRDDLEAALRELNPGDAVRVIRLKGAGRAFCAGYDLTPERGALQWRPNQRSGDNAWELGESRIALDREGLRASVDRWLWMWSYRKPIIAQVHGWCLAGGGEMIGACDIVVARAERPPGPLEPDHAHRVAGVQLAQRRLKIVTQPAGDRVELLRTIKRDRRDGPVDLHQHIFVFGHLALLCWASGRFARSGLDLFRLGQPNPVREHLALGFIHLLLDFEEVLALVEQIQQIVRAVALRRPAAAGLLEALFRLGQLEPAVFALGRLLQRFGDQRLP